MGARKRWGSVAALCVAVVGVICGPAAEQPATKSTKEWRLVWQDEFEGENGSRPDAAKWVYDLGGGGWGNNELQTYTDRAENARIEDGILVIEARKETFTGADGITRKYTSARLKTLGRFEQTYGRFEARIRLTSGQGLWPAFWMLGADIGKVDWPACGEIDVMENVGSEPARVLGSLHGPGYSGGDSLHGEFLLDGGRRFSDDFCLFAVEWEPAVVRFYVNENVYATFTPADLPAGATWVFDKPFFMLLNVAVGGNWPGPPDATTVFPQKLFVDYVRVYRRAG